MIAIFFIIFVFVLLFVVVPIIVYAGIKESKKANLAYEEALRLLSKDPNNPDLKLSALRLGRAHAAHNDPKLCEEAIMNEVNAACARAQTVAQNAKDVAGGIEKLWQLCEKGVITKEEYEKAKSLFLGAAPDKADTAIKLLEDLYTLKGQGVLSESEFNVKKWEILSERMLPGKA